MDEPMVSPSQRCYKSWCHTMGKTDDFFFFSKPSHKFATHKPGKETMTNWWRMSKLQAQKIWKVCIYTVQYSFVILLAIATGWPFSKSWGTHAAMLLAGGLQSSLFEMSIPRRLIEGSQIFINLCFRCTTQSDSFWGETRENQHGKIPAARWLHNSRFYLVIVSLNHFVRLHSPARALKRPLPHLVGFKHVRPSCVLLNPHVKPNKI